VGPSHIWGLPEDEGFQFRPVPLQKKNEMCAKFIINSHEQDMGYHPGSDSWCD
jgi:hypothetical protein